MSGFYFPAMKLPSNYTHQPIPLYRNYIEIQCATLGCAIFLLQYGVKILDPTFIGWLLSRDSATHFLGWHFFRSEPWGFPLGTIKSYIYPHGTSIVLTDSIPLLALPLKLLSTILPHPFQYLGLWLLTSYILQGFFGAKLLRQITHNQSLILIGVLFFLLSPIMTRKAGAQCALASHWLILAALHLYLSPQSSKKQYTWLILLTIASLIHFYLFFMVGTIWIAYLWRLKREGITVMKMMAITIGVTGMTMWIAGYFVIGLSATSAPGFGTVYMMNLLAPILPPFNNYFTFNPVNFLPTISQDLLGQRAGFNYLGLGALLMVTLALYQQLTHPFSFLTIKKHCPLIVAALVLFLLAISNKITFYDSVLIEINMPIFLKKCLGIIHASGRMFWPISYLLILTSIAVISKLNSAKRATYIMIFLIIIQVVDLWPDVKNKSIGSAQFKDPLKSKKWNEIANKISHIKIIPPERNKDDYIPFALLAGNNQKTINIGYAARANPDQTISQQNDLDDYNKGNYSADTLYIIKNSYPNMPVSTEKFTIKELDGYHIVTPREEYSLPRYPEW